MTHSIGPPAPSPAYPGPTTLVRAVEAPHAGEGAGGQDHAPLNLRNPSATLITGA